MERSDLYNVPSRLPLSLMETLTFRVRQPPGATFVSYTVGYVLRHKVTDEEKLARGLLNVTTIRFRLAQFGLDNASPSAAPTPKPRDQFTDSAGTTWTIAAGGVDSPLLGYYHDCLCQANPT